MLEEGVRSHGHVLIESFAAIISILIESSTSLPEILSSSYFAPQDSELAMSAPSNPRSRGPPATGEASGSQQPPISKAEQSRQRRAIQEQQRAAKAQAQTAAKVTGGALAKPGTKSGAAPQTPKKGGPAGASKQPTKDTAGTAGDDGLDKSRGLRIFSHFGLPKSATHVVKGDIHPAIVRLALQFSEFKISGANARCIASLTAFKTVRSILIIYRTWMAKSAPQVIQDYVTPPNNTLSRHLMTHLSPQITHLVAARPMSVTMGNAIRQLKLEISDSDIDLPEQDVRTLLATPALQVTLPISRRKTCFARRLTIISGIA